MINYWMSQSFRLKSDTCLLVFVLYSKSLKLPGYFLYKDRSGLEGGGKLEYPEKNQRPGVSAQRSIQLLAQCKLDSFKRKIKPKSGSIIARAGGDLSKHIIITD